VSSRLTFASTCNHCRAKPGILEAKTISENVRVDAQVEPGHDEAKWHVNNIAIHRRAVPSASFASASSSGTNLPRCCREAIFMTR